MLTLLRLVHGSSSVCAVSRTRKPKAASAGTLATALRNGAVHAVLETNTPLDAGPIVSMVIVNGPAGADSVPLSVWVTVRLCGPSASATLLVMVRVPPLPVPEPITSMPS